MLPNRILKLVCLENRLTPAVTAFFDPSVGSLQVSIDEGASTAQNASVSTLYGRVRVIGDQSLVSINSPTGIRGVLAKDIRSITINGSSLDNRIDIKGV